jgi:hypothetical protein
MMYVMYVCMYVCTHTWYEDTKTLIFNNATIIIIAHISYFYIKMYNLCTVHVSV